MEVRIGPVNVSHGGRFVEQGDTAIYIPAVIPARIEGERWDVEFTVENVARHDVPIVTELRLVMRDDGDPIAPNAVRGVRLGEAVERAVKYASMSYDRQADGSFVNARVMATPREARSAMRKRKRDEIDEEAERAADAYRRAKSERRSPITKAVAKDLTTSPATAHRRIQRARELGLLGGDE